PLDRPDAQRTGCPQGERSESIPPSPPSLRKSAYESTVFFSHIAHIKILLYCCAYHQGYPEK
ncbi:hypothetical protein OGY07_22890, partial [Citrobacter sp. Cs237]|uniref:hypothetical protein n=1 Tax=Citrobacter sp. Cs237 TaxID=2985156 RepID=UPI0025781D1B